MTSGSEWLARSDWSLRSPEFGDLDEGDAHVRMAFATADSIWKVWRALPSHRNVLAPDPSASSALRYAALDWKHAPLIVDGDPEAAARLATWGAELSWVAELLFRFAPRSALPQLRCPDVYVDLDGEIRVAFSGARSLPPEVVHDEGPGVDEPRLVFVVGQMLLGLVVAADETWQTPIGRAIQRCLDLDRVRRFATLAELRDALRLAGGRRIPPAGLRSPRPVWDQLEAGMGLLACGAPEKALRRFEAALRLDPRSVHARELAAEASQRHELDQARARLSIAISGETGSRTPLPRSWAEAAAAAMALELARNFAGALAVYTCARFDDADPLELDTAIARCHFQLGAFELVAAPAQRALQRAPDHVEAYELGVQALLRTRQHADALAGADAWLAVAPDARRAHYLRGRSLLGLGRPVEARDAFDRASPLLEAMLLRREVDRSIRGLRATVGAAGAMTLDVPEHLAELRGPLIAGRFDEGIALLRRAEHGRDAVAQRLLAELLSFDGRFEEALQIFDVAVELGDEMHAARLGKARTLLELDRAADALAAFERLSAERSDLVEAIEGRARALKQLGRDAEAEAAFRQAVAMTERGSDLRVRATERRGS